MAFAQSLILLYGFLNLSSNTSCTFPNFENAFLTAVSETVAEKNIVTKTAFYFFHNSDKFSIGSQIKSSNVLLVDMLVCYLHL